MNLETKLLQDIPSLSGLLTNEECKHHLANEDAYVMYYKDWHKVVENRISSELSKRLSDKDIDFNSEPVFEILYEEYLENSDFRIAEEYSFDALSHSEFITAVTTDNLDDSMRWVQDSLHIETGDICGIYWSQFDNANQNWKDSTLIQRSNHVEAYLELEVNYANTFGKTEPVNKPDNNLTIN